MWPRNVHWTRFLIGQKAYNSPYVGELPNWNINLIQD